MGANIYKLNITQLQSIISEYQATVKVLDSYMKEGVQLIKQTANYWTGKNMNDIIEGWNSSSQVLYEGIRFYQEKVPNLLEELQEQYRMMEQGKAMDVNLSTKVVTDSGLMAKIALTDINTIKYDSANAKQIEVKMRDLFTKIQANIKSLTKQIDSLSSTSDSLKKLVLQHQEESKIIEKKFENISDNMNAVIRKSCEVMEKTEGTYNMQDVTTKLKAKVAEKQEALKKEIAKGTEKIAAKEAEVVAKQEALKKAIANKVVPDASKEIEKAAKAKEVLEAIKVAKKSIK